MLNKLITGLENYVWTKVVDRLLSRVSAQEGRSVELGEVIDCEPILPQLEGPLPDKELGLPAKPKAAPKRTPRKRAS